jgi:hypothetical protein
MKAKSMKNHNHGAQVQLSLKIQELLSVITSALLKDIHNYYQTVS